MIIIYLYVNADGRGEVLDGRLQLPALQVEPGLRHVVARGETGTGSKLVS